MNERIEAVTAEQRFPDVEVVCECAKHEGCAALVSLTLDEYEAVRRVPTHFVVLPGHDLPEIERVVERTDRYLVVGKFGDGGKAAVKLDPRRRNQELTDPRH